MNISALELSKIFNLKLIGEDTIIEHLGLCNRDITKPNTLSYVTEQEYFEVALSKKNISVIICPPEIISDRHSLKTFLVSKNPEDTFYEIFEFLGKDIVYKFPKPKIGNNCDIHPTSIIEDGVEVGNNVIIGAFSIIHSKSIIGDNTIIGSHCAIGSNGFQALKNRDGKAYNVRHIGGVEIGRNCYIAEFVNISRGLFDTNVVIGDNVLIDVGCHIAHNCKIGNNSVLTANTKMFGSSSIGEDVWMSPDSMVMNRIHISDRCKIAPGSFVMTRTIPDTSYIGNPAIKESSYIKKEFKLRKLLK